MEAAMAKVLFTTAGGTAVTVGNVATGISLISGVAGGFQQRNAYIQQANGVKAQAQQEKLKAQEEGNLRRERLLKALAAQNVQAGAGGVRGGTTEQLRLESISEYQKEQKSADLMAELSQEKLRRDASGARKQGSAALTGSLLSTGTQLASIG